MRITELLAIRVHVPVAGLQSSAACTAPRGSLKPPALVPPVTRTSPVGSTVALRCRRGDAIGAGYIHSGFRSGEHTSEIQSRSDLVCRPLLEKKKRRYRHTRAHRGRSTGASTPNA